MTRAQESDSTGAVESLFDYATDAASARNYQRDDDPLLSAEALPENSSLLDFKSFAQEYPQRLFPLLDKLRPEFQELFIEYYLLEKSQNFLAQTHGQIQTRIWQNLRIIEQAVGALIVLGESPDEATLEPILRRAKLNDTPYGKLSDLIANYARTQSYALVAKAVGAPVPSIRKIFRPAIKILMEAKDLKLVAVGCYLRSLIHQASLTKKGMSKSYKRRLRSVKKICFDAPVNDSSPVLSFGNTAALHTTPWMMFELRSDHRITQIFPALRSHGKKFFCKKAAQIFAPIDENGDLKYGYIFARTLTPTLTKSLMRIRGIAEMAEVCRNDDDDGKAVTIPDADVQKMIAEHVVPAAEPVKKGDFVEVVTGPAARYCGTVLAVSKTSVLVQVTFPTTRTYQVTADLTAVHVLAVAPEKRAFWGRKV